MNKALRITSLLAVVLLAVLLNVPSAAQEIPSAPLPEREHPSRSINAISWIDQNENRLNAQSRETVSRFVYGVIAQGPDTPQKELFGTVGTGDFLVGDFTFVDLNGDGTLELVASIDAAGRPFFNTVVIIARTAKETRYDAIESWGPTHDFSKEILELGQNGVKQIVARVVEDYPHPEPALADALDESGLPVLPDNAWVNLFEWKSGKATEVNAKYPSYYQTTYLPVMEQAVQRIAEFPTATLEEKAALASNYKASAYRAQHVLGNKTAGLAPATEWASANSSVLQTNAVRVLSEIDTPDAITELKRIAGATGPGAERARLALQRSTVQQ